MDDPDKVEQQRIRTAAKVVGVLFAIVVIAILITYLG